jgi:hypothetical protein
VTTASWGGRELRRIPEAFERLIAELRSPILHEALERAEPISDVYRRRALQNSSRHYEPWGAELRGFCAMADAVCAFNPFYGQGMTSAALSPESSSERSSGSIPRIRASPPSSFGRNPFSSTAPGRSPSRGTSSTRAPPAGPPCGARCAASPDSSGRAIRAARRDRVLRGRGGVRATLPRHQPDGASRRSGARPGVRPARSSGAGRFRRRVRGAGPVPERPPTDEAVGSPGAQPR